MWKKLILRDALGVWLLLSGCLAAGIILNEMRAKPLSLVYSSPEARLAQAVERLGKEKRSPVREDGDVSLGEMQSISAARSAVILDARPGVFYQVGHIPSALSLPRDDFENSYRALAAVLDSRRNDMLVVYCSSSDCHDSQMVSDALERLGYRHVRLFRGGWGAWEGANLQEEKL